MTDRNKAIRSARAWLVHERRYLDTETTGLDDTAEIIELALLDKEGNPLIDTLVRPRFAIPQSAVDVHGITNEMVAGAPSMPELWPLLEPLLREKWLVIYNADYDCRLLKQSLNAWRIPMEPVAADCAMLAYARFFGDYNIYWNDYRWQKLGVAASQCGIEFPPNLHRARADAELCRRIVLHMSQAQLEEEVTNDPQA